MDLRYTDDIDSYLRVGTVLQLERKHLETCGEQFVLRGWQRGSHILVEAQLERGRSLVLPHHESCTARYLIDGTLCVFEGVILDWRIHKRDSQFRISWPERVGLREVRSEERTAVERDCRAELASGTNVPGTVRDLSPSGLQVRLESPISKGKSFFCSFVLPDGTTVDALPCVVRNVRQDKDRHIMGCQVVDSTCAAAQVIHLYLQRDRIMKHAAHDTADHVLLFAESGTSRVVLGDRLAALGVRAHITSGAIESFCMLRMTSPSIAVIDAKQPDLDALDMGGIVRKSFPNLPIYLLGADTALEPDVLARGLTGIIQDNAAEKVAGTLRDLLKGDAKATALT